MMYNYMAHEGTNLILFVIIGNECTHSLQCGESGERGARLDEMVLFVLKHTHTRLNRSPSLVFSVNTAIYDLHTIRLL
jgi:hypothetical protein